MKFFHYPQPLEISQEDIVDVWKLNGDETYEDVLDLIRFEDVMYDLEPEERDLIWECADFERIWKRVAQREVPSYLLIDLFDHMRSYSGPAPIGEFAHEPPLWFNITGTWIRYE